MQTRKDKLAAIARGFDLEIMDAFGSHAEDTLKWLNEEKDESSVSSPSDLDIGVKPASKENFL